MNNQLVNPVSRLLEYLPGIDMDKVAETLGMDKRKLNQNLEHKEEPNTVEEGMSLLYNPDESDGTFMSWKCTYCGNKSNTIAMDKVSEICSKCKKGLNATVLQNTATLQLRKFMLEYNQKLFCFKRNEDRSDTKGLPVLYNKITPEQETAIADLVSRANTKIYNLEQLLSLKKIKSQSGYKIDQNLDAVLKTCSEDATNLRSKSLFEWIQFGDICSKLHSDKVSCRHYAAIKRVQEAQA
jgi:hypothetical protein